MISHCFTRALKPSKTSLNCFFSDVPFFLLFCFFPMSTSVPEITVLNFAVTKRLPSQPGNRLLGVFSGIDLFFRYFNLMMLFVMLPDKLIYYYYYRKRQQWQMWVEKCVECIAQHGGRPATALRVRLLTLAHGQCPQTHGWQVRMRSSEW